MTLHVSFVKTSTFCKYILINNKHYEMDSLLMQKQVRENSEDLRNYLQGLGKWEEEMKRKEDELNDKDVVTEVPLVRNKSAKNNENTPTNPVKGKSKARLSSYDYSAWDKFDVDKELKKVDSPKDEPQAEDSDNEDVSEEYKTRLREESFYEKERGNQFVKNKKWDEAIGCYTHAIACYAKDPVFYANRALCFLKKEEFSNADTDCTASLQLDPNYVKALQRRAAARMGRKQFLEALADLSRILELEPHNKESKTELDKLEKQLGVTKPKVIPKITPKAPEVKTSTITPAPMKLEAPKNKIDIKENLIPWPERTQSENILAIRKLPHQRSKKPMKRIEVVESDSNEIDLNNDHIKAIETRSKCSEVKPNIQVNKTLKGESFDMEKNAQKSGEEDLKVVQTENQDEKNVKISENNLKFNKESKSGNKGFKIELTPELAEENCVKLLSNSENNAAEMGRLEKQAYYIPKTSVQFYANWKILGADDSLKSINLKQIGPAELPNIFRNSMEIDIFREIIQILCTFMKEIPNVHVFVENLTNLSRFSALTLFMSQDDRAALERIFQYCEAEGTMSIDNIHKLRIKYEL